MTLSSFARTFSVAAALAMVVLSWSGMLSAPAQAAPIAAHGA